MNNNIQNINTTNNQIPNNIQQNNMQTYQQNNNMNTIQPLQTQPMPPQNEPPVQNKKSKIGIIIEAIFGGIAVLVAIVFIILLGNKENPEKISKSYMNSLMQTNYEEAFKYVLLPEEYFIDIEDYYEYIKKTWNDMYKDYVEGIDVSTAADKYFYDGISIEEVELHYKKGFENMTKGSSGYKTTDYELIEVVDGKKENYVISSDIIKLNFGYKLTWVWTLNKDKRSMTNYSEICLKIDGDSFKIYKVTDEDLFSYSNDFTNKY